ncbi:hypothetical protein DFP72DRAFT_1069346 [Ephemerocybe angulata]|uniref:Uncharacterized protein n=1 Tax=Ephemerocybe angulata TaxID=980116 RepID=A0A8H6HUZ4_9AGAR|nr:hypothetical protein DFP72DRAFT_1069346 [Tulosesus angulatus]
MLSGPKPKTKSRPSLSAALRNSKRRSFLRKVSTPSAAKRQFGLSAKALPVDAGAVEKDEDHEMATPTAGTSGESLNPIDVDAAEVRDQSKTTTTTGTGAALELPLSDPTPGGKKIFSIFHNHAVEVGKQLEANVEAVEGEAKKEGILAMESTTPLVMKVTWDLHSLDTIAVGRGALESHLSDLLWFKARLITHHRNAVRTRYNLQKVLQAISRVRYLESRVEDLSGGILREGKREGEDKQEGPADK